MNRNHLIGAVMVLMLAGLAAAPVGAVCVLSGTIAWNATSAQAGSYAPYTYDVSASTGCAYYYIAMYNPSGVEVSNISTASAGPAVGTYPLGAIGDWTVYIGNTSVATQKTDTINVPTMYWPVITDLINGLASSFIPAVVTLVTGVVPLLVVIAVAGFIVTFVDRFDEWLGRLR